MEFDGNTIFKRYVILGAFSEKFKSQIPWGMHDIEDETDGGRVIKSITEVLQKWNLDSSDFYPWLEDKLQQSKD